MTRFIAPALVVLVAAAIAGEPPAPLPPPDAPVGKIAVAVGGAVTYDGVPITIDELGTRLAELKRRNGRGWYYREPGEEGLPAAAKAVLDLVIANKLPISLFTKPDYSEYVTQDGQTKTRDVGPRPK